MEDTEILTNLETTVQREMLNTKRASSKLVRLQPSQINNVLLELAQLTALRHKEILEANRQDLKRMDPDDPKYDRLKLTDHRLEMIERDLKAVAELPTPLGITLETRTVSSGLRLEKVSVPLGVIAVIYESRPNVTFDVFSLCFKAGNATILKGSKDAHHSNIAIVSIIKEVLSQFDLQDCLYLAPSERAMLPTILEATNHIDVIIPRGSAGLINYVRNHAKVPVIETGAGIVHTYYDASADLKKGKAIIKNAKTRRVSVCNALDTLLIHRNRTSDLKEIFSGLDRQFNLIVYADEIAFGALQDHYDQNLLYRADPAHFGTEFLSMKMSVKVVNDLSEALAHIEKHSSKHSEAIIAESREVIDEFMLSVDSATVYANASTAFTDGAEFGLGAEIGISTQKIHARGPMGLREITSYKWLIQGDGHIRT